MKISERDVAKLIQAQVIDRTTGDRIIRYIHEQNLDRPRLDASHTAYYLGALVVMSAMGWFMNEAWSHYGGGVLTAVAIAYAIAFWVAGDSLWSKPGLRQPAGLLCTLAVWMVPLAVFGVQYTVGWWPREPQTSYQAYFLRASGSWVVIELATIVAALTALRHRPFPFLTFPLAFPLWFLCIDLSFLLVGSPSAGGFEHRRFITQVFGAGVLSATYFLDRRTDEDYAFWLYLFGLLAFWGAMTVQGVAGILYAAINLWLLFIAIVLERKTFMVFGAVGIYCYLAHMAFTVFKDSLFFPVVLTALGVGIIGLGVWWRQHEAALDTAILSLLPEPFRNTLPRNRTSAGGSRL